MSWRDYKVGMKVRWFGKDFDGSWDILCTVSEVHDDYALAVYDDVRLLIDDYSAYMFKKA